MSQGFEAEKPPGSLEWDPDPKEEWQCLPTPPRVLRGGCPRECRTLRSRTLGRCHLGPQTLKGQGSSPSPGSGVSVAPAGVA